MLSQDPGLHEFLEAAEGDEHLVVRPPHGFIILRGLEGDVPLLLEDADDFGGLAVDGERPPHRVFQAHLLGDLGAEHDHRGAGAAVRGGEGAPLRELEVGEVQAVLTDGMQQ